MTSDPRLLQTVYGMTETGPVVYQSLPSDPLEQVTATAGILSEHMEVGVMEQLHRA
jgi:hypothetical protein